MHALVYWCVAVTVVFQASLTLPVNSVKNSKEQEVAELQCRGWGVICKEGGTVKQILLI